MEILECKKCGAALEENTIQCVYCGARYDGGQIIESPGNLPSKPISFFNLPQEVGEFGISHDRFFLIIALIIFGVYMLGWFFEDLEYWLADQAILIWMGLMPVLLLIAALVWKTNRKTLLIGLANSGLLFLLHLLIIWSIRGSLWDDHIGIAAMVAAGSFTGWLLGRLGHLLIRWKKAQEQ